MTAVRTVRRGALRGLAAGVLALGWAYGAVGAEAKVGVVALALWGDQGVFRSEATQAARVIAGRYGAGPSAIRINTRSAFAAGPQGMVQAIDRVDRALDPDRDVLFVVLTSHGSPQGIAEKGGRTEGILSPASLGAILAHARVRHRVLIVSACFSGIFASLASPDQLVITAADADHPSFGCTATARWTYFGQAFFDQAMRRGTRDHAPLDRVFQDASALVRARELKEGFDPSNPQIAGGAQVLETLAGEAPPAGH